MLHGMSSRRDFTPNTDRPHAPGRPRQARRSYRVYGRRHHTRRRFHPPRKNCGGHVMGIGVLGPLPRAGAVDSFGDPAMRSVRPRSDLSRGTVACLNTEGQWTSPSSQN